MITFCQFEWSRFFIGIVSRTEKLSLKTVLDTFFVSFLCTKNTRTDVFNNQMQRDINKSVWISLNLFKICVKNFRMQTLFPISLLFWWCKLLNHKPSRTNPFFYHKLHKFSQNWNDRKLGWFFLPLIKRLKWFVSRRFGRF